MSEEHTEPRFAAVPITASLAEFTDKLIARRGVEQSNLLFGGQIGPASQALSGRTNVIGVGDLAPDFSLPTAKTTTWSLAEHLAERKYSSLVVVFYRGTWCAYCNIYLRGLLESRSLLSDANAALIAVSPEAAPVSVDMPVPLARRFRSSSITAGKLPSSSASPLKWMMPRKAS